MLPNVDEIPAHGVGAVAIGAGRLRIEEHLSLQERVYRRLREAIVSGSLAPGQRLIETSLAEQLGVSRSPVREAIRRLAQDGLVTFVPRRGVSVGNPSPGEVEEVYTIRGALEALAARLAACRRSARQLEQLRRTLARMERATENGDHSGLLRADNDFHRALVEASGNQRLIEIAAALLDTSRRVRQSVLSGDTSWARTTWENHRAVLAALESPDPEAAAMLVSTHMERAKERMLAMMTAGDERSATPASP